MTTKLANTVALLLVAAFGAVYLAQTWRIAAEPGSSAFGPSFFPAALGVLLLVFCVIAAVREWKAENLTIEIGNKADVALTFVMSLVYVGLWQSFGYFYLFTGLLFFALPLIYMRRMLSARVIGFAVLWAIVFTGLLYLAFEVALHTSFA